MKKCIKQYVKVLYMSVLHFIVQKVQSPEVI